MTNKNLFLYDLAIVAIFKDEAPYLKEWLDYHLVAGVEHFYLYNNDSTDNYQEVLAPYVESNLVTLTDFPGRLAMFPAYNDALEKYRFDCRYIAFIDLDEFIYPKTNRSIVEVVDKILLQNTSAAGLAINWQVFGSNGQETADYSRGVMERFTRRAPVDWSGLTEKDGNLYRKTISNPRLIFHAINPHFAYYFDEKLPVNSDAEAINFSYESKPIHADKIVINHYYIKSKEEYEKRKMPKGSSCMDYTYVMKNFYDNDRNEVFDDGILKYRAARAENFSIESDADRIRRVENALIETLTQTSPFDASGEFFNGKLETFLTCRALAERLGTKIGNKMAEEYALVWIYMLFIKATVMTRADIQLFMKALPEILARPFSICKKLNQLACDIILPNFCKALKSGEIIKGHNDWKARDNWLYIQKLLRLIK